MAKGLPQEASDDFETCASDEEINEYNNLNSKSMLEQIQDILMSPRFKAFYWFTGITAGVGFLSLIIEIIPTLGLSEFTTVAIVTVIAQITKALMNLRNDKPMGFSAK